MSKTDNLAFETNFKKLEMLSE